MASQPICLRLSAALLAWLLLMGAAAAQTGPRIIDTPHPLPNTRRPARGTIAPTGGSVTAPKGNPARRIILRDLRVTGAAHLAPRAIAALWQGKRGQLVSLDDIRHIAEAIGALYRGAGYALYTVTLPAQNFVGGVVVVNVVEGYVNNVVIQGDTAARDLSLLKAYAAAIAADRPLQRATLERYILLMNDIPGLTVGSQLKAVAGKPGATVLTLTIKRKQFDGGIGVDNQGTPLLARTEIALNGVANSLFREGDRTQLVYGFPPGAFGRYQYYALNHAEPLGTNGLTIDGSAAYLTTKPDGSNESGDAVLLGLHLNDPLIRSVHRTLIATVGIDALNSDDAILGTTLTDERTRVLRAALAYTRDDLWNGVFRGDARLSQGVAGLGARRGSIAFGGPQFTKLDMRVERAQPLPGAFILRLRATGQYAGTHLPASEQFAFGGEDFGRAFYLDTLNGDRAVAGGAELAYPVAAPFAKGYVDGTELFGFGDWGRVWTVDTLYQPATDRGASAGFGVRAKLLNRTVVELEAATPLLRPRYTPSPDSWRFIFGIHNAF